MTPTTGLLAAAALLLAVAGCGKAARPAPAAIALTQARVPLRRVLARRPLVWAYGVVELAAAVVVLAVGGRTGAVVLVGAYAVLVAVAARIARTAPDAACGCFGGATDRVGRSHLVVTAAGVVVGLLGVLWPADALIPAFARGPAAALLVSVVAGVLALVAYAVLSALPAVLAGRAALTPTGGTP